MLQNFLPNPYTLAYFCSLEKKLLATQFTGQSNYATCMKKYSTLCFQGMDPHTPRAGWSQSSPYLTKLLGI